MLMRLGCSLEGGQRAVDQEKMCLALVLRPSRGLNIGYMRLRDNALTFINSRYFRSPGKFLDLDHRIYLYHADNESRGRRGLLTISESFREAFRIKTAYPTFADPATGAVHRILLGPSGWKYGRIADIYLDCAAPNGRRFALRVFIFGVPATKKDGSHIWPDKPWRACLYICRSRQRYNMVELMLNAPELMPHYQRVEFCEPGIEWKPCMSVVGYEVFLRQNTDAENAEDKRGWTLEARPCADEVLLTLKESLAVQRITSWPIDGLSQVDEKMDLPDQD